MTDPFANVVSPVFQHVIDFQHRLEQGESPALLAEREELLAVLDEAEQKASAARQLADDFELAKYALVYWIDEILINSSWREAAEWRQYILEWDIYQERLRADRFFEKAQEAEALAGTDPLETYFLCVALGFRGKYADNRAGLQKWSERAYGRIVSGSTQPERFLPDEPRDEERQPLQPLPGKSVLLAVSVLVSLTVLVTLVCFLMVGQQ